MRADANVNARRRHEAPELAAASKRMAKALVRRAAEGDTEALEGLLGLQATLDEFITEAGRAMHDEAGYSWTELATVMGITRQGARQRFTARPSSSDQAAREAAHYGELIV